VTERFLSGGAYCTVHCGYHEKVKMYEVNVGKEGVEQQAGVYIILDIQFY
jgi:hypothetical protein